MASLPRNAVDDVPATKQDADPGSGIVDRGYLASQCLGPLIKCRASRAVQAGTSWETSWASAPWLSPSVNDTRPSQGINHVPGRQVPSPTRPARGPFQTRSSPPLQIPPGGPRTPCNALGARLRPSQTVNGPLERGALAGCRKSALAVAIVADEDGDRRVRGRCVRECRYAAAAGQGDPDPGRSGMPVRCSSSRCCGGFSPIVGATRGHSTWPLTIPLLLDAGGDALDLYEEARIDDVVHVANTAIASGVVGALFAPQGRRTLAGGAHRRRRRDRRRQRPGS